ncbi:rod shape-determining protein [Shigella flexneri]
MKLLPSASSAIGSAYPGEEVREIEVRGQTWLKVCRAVYPELQRDPGSAARAAVRYRLRRDGGAGAISAELASDISERGMVLTGGGALLRRLTVC